MHDTFICIERKNANCDMEERQNSRIEVSESHLVIQKCHANNQTLSIIDVVMQLGGSTAHGIWKAP